MAPQPLHSLTLSPPLTGHAGCKCSTVPLFGKRLPLVVAFPRAVASCSAVQESSTATTVSEKKEADGDNKEATAEAQPAAKPAAKPKKAPSKPLPEMMQDEVIPPLKAALEAEDVSQVELSFQDNTLEGSFIKDEITYYFWAFFPKGDLTGPKGFSMSSYGAEVSTIEPFLIDEKRITPKHVVFWVHKRLAGQGILPVWKEEEAEGEGAE